MWIKKIFLQNKDCPKRNTLPPSYKFGHFPRTAHLEESMTKTINIFIQNFKIKIDTLYRHVIVFSVFRGMILTRRSTLPLIMVSFNKLKSLFWKV